MSIQSWAPSESSKNVFGLIAPVDRVTITGGFLADLERKNRETTLPHIVEKLYSAGNIDNVRRLTGESDAAFTGQLFADSDIYKTLEAIAWVLGSEPDQELAEFYDQTVELLSRAQQEDGYLNSAYQLAEGDRTPWSNFTHGHELYCLGHLIEAGVAGYRALNDDRLLQIAVRFVDLVSTLYGNDSEVYGGHPEVELALISLFNVTQNPDHLDLAERFIRRRGSGFIGNGVYGAQYYQDDTPVEATRIMRGHAVRALYLNSGVADLYRERPDESLIEALNSQWHDLVSRRMYITGGTGARHRDEAFGDAYELPSERAYAETCAGIALMGWAWRMYLATSSASYLDVYETAWFNVVLAGISEDGMHFSYSNPLQRRADHGASQEESSGRRLEWFSCACCPPNLARTIATMRQRIATSCGKELQIVNFADARVDLPSRDGMASAKITTDYPVSGRVRISVEGAPDATDLALRIPAWALRQGASPTLTVNGEPRAIDEAEISDGFLRIFDVLHHGAEIEIELPMNVQIQYPHPRIDAVRGTVAVTRGPLVYCVEQDDNQSDIDEVLLLADQEAQIRQDLQTAFGPLIEVGGLETRSTSSDPLYSTEPTDDLSSDVKPVTLRLRPYATWGNQLQISSMRVWLPRFAGQISSPSSTR